MGSARLAHKTGSVLRAVALAAAAMLPTFLLASALLAGGTPAPDEASMAIRTRRPRAVLIATGPEGAPLVVVDAGHGGHDQGAVAADGTPEKQLTLAIAQDVAAALARTGRLRVAMTRTDDEAVDLTERREIARAAGAALLLSIHCDSAPNRRARGVTVYTLSDQPVDDAAAALAVRENRVDGGADLLAETSDVPAILLDLARRQTAADAASFAGLLARALVPALAPRQVFLRGAGFRVLRAPDLPAALLETGYLTNDGDLALLKSANYRRALADGVARAAQAFFARRPAQAGGVGR